MELAIHLADDLKAKPDESNLGFGIHNTDRLKIHTVGLSLFDVVNLKEKAQELEKINWIKKRISG